MRTSVYRIRPGTRRDRNSWLPGTRRCEPVGWPAIHHAPPAPERMFCERGLTNAYRFSRHSYSATARALDGIRLSAQISLIMIFAHEYAQPGMNMRSANTLSSAELDVGRRCGPRRSPRSVAVEENRPEVGLPPVTALRDSSSSHGRLRARDPAALAAGAPPGRRGRARRNRLVGSQIRLSGGSGKVSGDDVGGVPVETAPRRVIAHRGARVGVRGRFLHVPKRDPGVKGGSNERVPQGMWPDRFGDPGAAGYPANDPRGAVPV